MEDDFYNMNTFNKSETNKDNRLLISIVGKWLLTLDHDCSFMEIY